MLEWQLSSVFLLSYSVVALNLQSQLCVSTWYSVLWVLNGLFRIASFFWNQGSKLPTSCLPDKHTCHWANSLAPQTFFIVFPLRGICLVFFWMTRLPPNRCFSALSRRCGQSTQESMVWCWLAGNSFSPIFWRDLAAHRVLCAGSICLWSWDIVPTAGLMLFNSHDGRPGKSGNLFCIPLYLVLSRLTRF